MPRLENRHLIIIEQNLPQLKLHPLLPILRAPVIVVRIGVAISWLIGLGPLLASSILAMVVMRVVVVIVIVIVVIQIAVVVGVAHSCASRSSMCRRGTEVGLAGRWIVGVFSLEDFETLRRDAHVAELDLGS